MLFTVSLPQSKDLSSTGLTREREHAAYMRTLTPDDIKRENVFRTAQRKAGKSRKGNLKDPNAPKKPLSAYFMFLQRIRSDAELVKEVVAKVQKEDGEEPKDVKIVYKPMPTDDPQKRRPDTSRAKASLDWQPRWTVRMGLEEMVRYYKAKMAEGSL